MTTPSPSTKEVTGLLSDWSRGDRAALERLTPLVYDELHRLAHRYMSRERPDHTLQTTALVNEAYLRLVDQRNAHWQNRAHFFAVAAQVMRHILVDYARQRHFAKRGGEARRVTLDEAAIVSQQRAAEFVALDEALKRLEAIDPRKSRVVELHFFGGLNFEEIAEVLKVSAVTVRRDWRSAKAWLYKAVTSDE
ncbi:MAG TPA: sigma-70 family RNA polymerase sigma factor [Pyrinomonadaceae bacterium]|jgi:RNA polymerase sigma factor (TIGR02999 family)